MLKEVILSEETVELAMEKACKTLGQNKENINFEILQQPTKGVFGVFGGKMAQIRAIVKETPAQKALNFLKSILPNMGLDSLTVDILSEENEYCEIKIDGGVDVSFVLGRHGEVLDSLQYLCGLIANDSCHEESRFCRIRLEAGEYRENRRRTLMSLGKNIAEQVYRLGKPIALEPMKSYDRMVIHMAVDKIRGVRSWSEGNDKVRWVVIAPEFMSQKAVSAVSANSSADIDLEEDFKNSNYAPKTPDYIDPYGTAYNKRDYKYSNYNHSNSYKSNYEDRPNFEYREPKEAQENYYKKPEFSTSDSNYSASDNYSANKYEKYNRYYQGDTDYFNTHHDMLENPEVIKPPVEVLSETQDIKTQEYKS